MGTDSNDAVLARIEQLEAEGKELLDKVRTLEAERERPVVTAAAAGDGPVSRRRLLGMAGAATAGAVGATVLAAAPAGAGVDGDVVLGVDSQAGGAAVTGITSTAVSTIRGVNSGTGSGVFGSADSGAGVSGFTNSGNALEAAAPFTSSGAHLRLTPATGAGAPAAGAHTLGQFWMDSSGALFQCTVAGTGAAAVWVRQSPLVLLASPFRVYDSRAGQPNPSGSPQGGLALNATRTINCTPALPAGVTVATGLLMNVTLANTVGAKGAVTVFSAAVAAPSTSSVNWAAANTNIANAVTSACDSSQDIKVKCVSGTSTQFIVDVIGYYP